MPKITYYHETENQLLTIEFPVGGTLLDASLAHGIPHSHACCGNARCTTCRVRVLDGGSYLAPRTAAEQKVALEKNWPEDIRLACQAKVLGDVKIRQLVLDSVAKNTSAEKCPDVMTGHERSLVVMFCDIANFTGFATQHLPYDVVYLLNRYFKEVCEPILTHQGYIDKYIGDGLMAIFGIEQRDPLENCLQAVQASLQMQTQVAELNKSVVKDFSHEFKIRIGLHYGLVIVGEIGHPSKRQLTVLGDTVNVASRIESANKEFGTTLLVSQDMMEHLENKVNIGRVVKTQLRGQSRTHVLYEITGLIDS